LKETLKAYLAGILDGEGTISICDSRKNYGWHKSGEVQLALSVTMSDKEVIQLFSQAFGSKVIFYKDGMGPNARRPAFRWQKSQKAAGRVISLLLPYLRTKRPQAELALKFLEEFNPQTGRGPIPSSVIVMEKRRAFAAQMRVLNGRYGSNGYDRRRLEER
jgi:hypothetical protein